MAEATGSVMAQRSAAAKGKSQHSKAPHNVLNAVSRCIKPHRAASAIIAIWALYKSVRH